MPFSDSFVDGFEKRQGSGRSKKARNYKNKRALYMSRTYDEYEKTHIAPARSSEQIISYVVGKLKMKYPTMSELMRVTLQNDATGRRHSAAAALAVLRHKFSNYDACIEELVKKGAGGGKFILKIHATLKGIKAYPDFTTVGMNMIRKFIQDERDRNNPFSFRVNLESDNVNYRIWEE